MSSVTTRRGRCTGWWRRSSSCTASSSGSVGSSLASSSWHTVARLTGAESYLAYVSTLRETAEWLVERPQVLFYLQTFRDTMFTPVPPAPPRTPDDLAATYREVTSNPPCPIAPDRRPAASCKARCRWCLCRWWELRRASEARSRCHTIVNPSQYTPTAHFSLPTRMHLPLSHM